MSDKVVKLIEDVKALTVLELSELVKRFRCCSGCCCCCSGCCRCSGC